MVILPLEKVKAKTHFFVAGFGLSLVLFPSLVFGAFSSVYIESMMKVIKNTVAALIPVMVGLTFIYFAWCMINYIRSSGDDKIKTKNSLIWSVIAIVLVVSILGIINLLKSIFALTGNTITLPGIPSL